MSPAANPLLATRSVTRIARRVFAVLIALDLDGRSSLRARRGRRLRAWERQRSRVTFASIFRLDSRQRPVGRVA